MTQTVVVGGGTGLGAALVSSLIERDHKVIVVGRTKPSEEQRIGRFYSVDAKDVGWPSLYAVIEKENEAPINTVIFVAGEGVFGRANLIPVERARQVFELNFWACTSAAKAAAEYWSDRHIGGKFAAILSIAARRAVPFESYYSASKAATARFLECLQLEYGHKGINFVSAFPGLLNTQFRRRAEWYGVEPTFADEGADVDKTARSVVDLLAGKRKARILGWRERTIDVADRVWPGLYDRTVLQRRVQKSLK